MNIEAMKSDLTPRRLGLFGRSRSKAVGDAAQVPPVLVDTIRLLDGAAIGYGTVYRKLPPVRTVVDFLADSVADTPLPVYERAEVGRPEARDHPLAVTLREPNPDLTSRRLVWGTVADVGIYGNAYWRIVEAQSRERSAYLVPLPPFRVTPRGGDLLTPTSYDFYPVNGGQPKHLSADEVVHFRLYDPEDRRVGSSKLEALRAVLNEEVQASRYRLSFWKRHAAMVGMLLHPGRLSDEAYERLVESFDQTYGGSENAGKTFIGEEGLDWKAIGSSPKDAEFIAGRQFVLEATARVFGIPLSLLSLTATATFASQREFRKQLYCVTPETPVLKADLTYVAAGKLALGDEVFAFDEEPLEGNNDRRFRTATVTNTTRGTQPLVRVETTHSTVVVSAGHPFLVTNKVKRAPQIKGCFQWVRADALDPVLHSIVSLGPVWEREETYEAGWLAGMADGEGYAVKLGGVGIVQKEGAALQRIEAELTARGYEYGRHTTGKDKGVKSVTISGGSAETLRFFGTIRPERLIAKRRWLERSNLKRLPKAEILSVEHLGDGEVVELSTSTRTFVAAGLLSHNTEVLPPWYELIQSEIMLQLLPMLGGGNVYPEFLVESKLRGDFVDQAAIVYQAVGRPYMTVLEGRKLFNLPDRDDDRDDELVVPVGPNLALESQAEQQSAQIVALPSSRAAALESFFDRQERSIRSKRGAGAKDFDAARWNRELADVLGSAEVAERVNLRTHADLAAGQDVHEVFQRARESAPIIAQLAAQSA